MEDLKVPAEVETEGLKAYEQVGAFERLCSWRLQVSYAVLALIPALSGLTLWFGYLSLPIQRFLAVACFLTAIFFVACAVVHWRYLKARHVKNLALLAKLKGEYGDKLSWVQMENHFAAMEQLQRDLAGEKGKD